MTKLLSIVIHANAQVTENQRTWVEQLSNLDPELEVKSINTSGNWISFKAGLRTWSEITPQNIRPRIQHVNQRIRGLMDASHLFQGATLFTYQQDLNVKVTIPIVITCMIA
jgi:hypothetical protein